MTGIKDILGQCQDRLLQPLSMDEAMLLLGRERWDRVEQSLTKEQRKILEFLVTTDRFVGGKEVADLLHKKQSNVSGYYFRPLKDLGIIEEKHKQGRNVYFGLTTEYQPLKWWLQSENNLKKEISDSKIDQLKLFNL